MKSLAIIIPIWNERETIIKDCFDAYSKIKYDGEYKVYIAINYQDKKVIDICNKYLPSNFILNISKNKSHLKASNINAVLPKIKEDVIAIFDVDNVPLGNYCNACVNALNDEVGLSVGRGYFPNRNKNILTKYEEFVQIDSIQCIENLYKLVNNGVMPITNAGYFMERKTWNKLILNENTVTEDIDLSIQLDEQQIKGVIVNEYVTIPLAEGFRNSFNQSVRWITGAFTFPKHHQNAFEKNTNMAVLLAPNFLLYMTTVYKIFLALFLLISLPFYFSIPIILSLLWYDLENQYWQFMRVHGCITKYGKPLSRKIAYFVGLMEYINLIIAIKAYYKYKFKPLDWYLTKK